MPSKYNVKVDSDLVIAVDHKNEHDFRFNDTDYNEFQSFINLYTKYIACGDIDDVNINVHATALADLRQQLAVVDMFRTCDSIVK